MLRIGFKNFQPNFLIFIVFRLDDCTIEWICTCRVDFNIYRIPFNILIMLVYLLLVIIIVHFHIIFQICYFNFQIINVYFENLCFDSFIYINIYIYNT